MTPQTFVTIFCYKCNKICNKTVNFFVQNGNKSNWVNDPLDVIPRNGEYEAENVKMHGVLGESDCETEKIQGLRGGKRFQEMRCRYTQSIHR